MRRLLAILLALLLGVTVLTGCAEELAEPGAGCRAEGMILVAGAHANQPAPDLTPQLACDVKATIAAGLPIGVLTVEGDPQVLLAPRVADVGGDNPRETEAMVLRAYNSVVGTVQQAAASTAGSDLFAALRRSADAARTAAPPITRIVVIDNGISDSGAVDLTGDGMVIADAQHLAEHLITSGELKADTFAGLEFELVGLAATQSPQEPLTAGMRDNLGALWQAVIAAGGGASVLTPYPRDGEAPDTEQRTATVDVPDLVPFDPQLGEPKKFDDSSALGFEGGTARLRSPEDAKVVLRDLAEWLKPGCANRVLITGTTSSDGGASGDQALSADRAITIAELLVSMGADGRCIETRGAGYIADPPDRDEDGTVDPAKAALNRSVRIDPL